MNEQRPDCDRYCMAPVGSHHERCGVIRRSVELEISADDWAAAEAEWVQYISPDPALMCRCGHWLHDGEPCPRRSCGCTKSRPQKEATE